MSAELRVTATGGDYTVRIGPGVIDQVGVALAALGGSRGVIIVTDDRVETLYAPRVLTSVASVARSVHVHVVPAGERAKSWSTAGSVLEAFAQAGLGRDAVIVALGGGVVGDLAGFCAAAYMRGIAVVQVPTTLLAQVDSSIGGKTGVDLPHGKNLVGAFWPPKAVLSDTACLATLSEVEWRSGMAEVVKSAVLDGEGAVAMLEMHAGDLAAREAAAVEVAVVMAAGLKTRVVSGDERESGAREALNYGHTLGHAIEKVAGYGVVPHGVAVAEGMRFAALLGERFGVGNAAWSDRQARLLDAAELPAMGCPYAAEDLLEAMRADKKARDGAVRFVLSSGPGAWEVRAVEDAVLGETLAQWCLRDASDGDVDGSRS